MLCFVWDPTFLWVSPGVLNSTVHTTKMWNKSRKHCVKLEQEHIFYLRFQSFPNPSSKPESTHHFHFFVPNFVPLFMAVFVYSDLLWFPSWKLKASVPHSNLFVFSQTLNWILVIFFLSCFGCLFFFQVTPCVKWFSCGSWLKRAYPDCVL